MSLAKKRIYHWHVHTIEDRATMQIRTDHVKGETLLDAALIWCGAHLASEEGEYLTITCPEDGDFAHLWAFGQIFFVIEDAEITH